MYIYIYIHTYRLQDLWQHAVRDEERGVLGHGHGEGRGVEKRHVPSRSNFNALCNITHNDIYIYIYTHYVVYYTNT